MYVQFVSGLRLLPASQAEAIIDEVEKVLLYSGFKLEKTLVEIMNPRDEGLYAWFTVNFLLDIFSQSLMESYVSLDLGGGSTQITFAPAEYPIGGLEGRKHFLHNVTILGGRREVYTHSYLGLGLMAAREAIFTQGNERQKLKSIHNALKLTGFKRMSRFIEHVCLRGSFQVNWTITGTARGIFSSTTGVFNSVSYSKHETMKSAD